MKLQTLKDLYVHQVKALNSAEEQILEMLVGKHIIPASLRKYKVFAYIFQEYWEDIGTVRAFFEANLALTDAVPTFNFFDQIDPVYTIQRFLPASKVSGTLVQRAIIADGCIITDAYIDRAVVGIRSVIESGTTIRNSVIMGADFYPEEAPKLKSDDSPPGIGRHCHVEGAIIDKNARVGEGAVITSKVSPRTRTAKTITFATGSSLCRKAP